jgi:hypothetical protein
MSRALKISKAGGETWIAGARNAIMVSVDISVSIEGDCPGMIHVSGMNDLDGDRQSHTSWLECVAVESTAEFTIQFLETDTFTPPAKEVATDSEEHLKEIADFNEMVAKDPPRPRIMENNFPDSGITATLPNGEVIEARFESGRQFMAFRFHWNKFRPDRCRVSLSSNSMTEAMNRIDGRQWCQMNLALGESVHVRVN